MSSLDSGARRRKQPSKMKSMGDHKAFLARIKKSLYYGKLPATDRFSMPVSELAAELFSSAHGGLRRLEPGDAGGVSRDACASPCALVLALVYLDRLRSADPDYLHRTPPDELFLVSLLVASKFLQDEGSEDEVISEAWAASARLNPAQLNGFERDFLNAIGWDVFVSSADFWLRLARLERLIAIREASTRGWYTYADLVAVASANHLASLAHTIISVSAVCLASYTAGVLALIGSCILVSHVPGSAIGPALNSSPLSSDTTPSTTIETDPLQARLDNTLTWDNDDSLPIGIRSPVTNHYADYSSLTHNDRPEDRGNNWLTDPDAGSRWLANDEAVLAWLTLEPTATANVSIGRYSSSPWLRWWHGLWRNETWLLLAPPLSVVCQA